MVTFEPRQVIASAEVPADPLPARRHSTPLYMAAEFVIEAIGEDAATYAAARGRRPRCNPSIAAAIWRMLLANSYTVVTPFPKRIATPAVQNSSAIAGVPGGNTSIMEIEVSLGTREGPDILNQ